MSGENVLPLAIWVEDDAVLGLRCPTCGAVNEVRYVEDVEAWRHVVGLATEDGSREIKIEGYAEVPDYDGARPRLLCTACGSTCGLPMGAKVEFV